MNRSVNTAHVFDRNLRSAFSTNVSAGADAMLIILKGIDYRTEVRGM